MRAGVQGERGAMGAELGRLRGGGGGGGSAVFARGREGEGGAVWGNGLDGFIFYHSLEVVEHNREPIQLLHKLLVLAAKLCEFLFCCSLFLDGCISVHESRYI